MESYRPPAGDSQTDCRVLADWTAQGGSQKSACWEETLLSGLTPEKRRPKKSPEVGYVSLCPATRDEFR